MTMTARIQRVEEAIKEEVAQILQRELKDPRIGFVTITRVKVTADLQHATVYFSLLEGHAPGGISGEASFSRSHGSKKETEAGLKSAQGYVRRLLGERLRIRVTPEVSFRADPSVAEGIRMSKLLDDLRKSSE